MLVVKIKVKQELLSISAELAVGNEILTISGPSGCGKTTLLKSIAGITPPDDSFIRLNGRILFPQLRK